jgi:hypothetical protein
MRYGCSFVQVSAGDLHTCALGVGDAVVCWGDGSHGELGDGAGMSSATPAMVRGLDP